MISRQITRLFHNTSCIWNVKKSDLSKLRKKTGYTFQNCKKALELHNNLEEAEKWLKEQALSLGWSKANKLQGRKTTQGLVGVTVRGNHAVMLEINCETDFVARNRKFQSFVEVITSSCILEAMKTPTDSEIKKINVNTEELKHLHGPGGKSLADLSALTIADLGENINLSRAIYINCPKDIKLAAYAHPNNQNTSDLFTGKYAAVVAYTANSYGNRLKSYAEQLCQHVVGMNPQKVGVFGEDEPLPNQDDETTMIHQEFLLEPELTVHQFLLNAGINLIEFTRIECGEETEVSQNHIPIKAIG